MKNVAVLGIGIMGRAFALNLLAAGYTVRVFNRSREKAQSLADLGAIVCHTPSEAAQSSTIIIGIVEDDTASRAIWLGESGALRAAAPGSTVIESSTLSLQWTGELAEHALGHKCIFLDAPVSGSKAQAAAAELDFFVGGTEDALPAVMPIFQSLGKRIYHLGDVGSGMKMKLTNNLLNTIQMLALAEGLALAQRLGLNLEQVGEILSEGAPGSKIVRNKMAHMIRRDYTVQSKLSITRKDLQYILEAAEAVGADLQLAAKTYARFTEGVAHKLSDLDVSSISELYQVQGKDDG